MYDILDFLKNFSGLASLAGSVRDTNKEGREVSETPIVRDGSSAEQRTRNIWKEDKEEYLLGACGGLWGLVAGDEARRGRI